MPDIIVALIAAGAAIGTAAIGFAGIQRGRSRGVEAPTDPPLSADNSNTPRQVEAPTSNQSQGSTSDGITINANDARQVIGRNHGNVTQVNHYGRKRDR